MNPRAVMLTLLRAAAHPEQLTNEIAKFADPDSPAAMILTETINELAGLVYQDQESPPEPQSDDESELPPCTCDHPTLPEILRFAWPWRTPPRIPSCSPRP